MTLYSLSHHVGPRGIRRRLFTVEPSHTDCWVLTKCGDTSSTFGWCDQHDVSSKDLNKDHLVRPGPELQLQESIAFGITQSEGFRLCRCATDDREKMEADVCIFNNRDVQQLMLQREWPSAKKLQSC